MIARRRDLLYDVLMHVRPLTLASARVVEMSWGVHGVTVGMRALLAALAATGPRPVPDIASDLDLTRQAVQRHVNDLGSLGLIETRHNPAHRRSVLVALTDDGEQLWREQHEADLAALAPMAAECSPADLEAAVRVLEALDTDVRARARGLMASQGSDGH